MRVTVGDQLLGDSYETAPIGGFSCSGGTLIQEAQGTCDGWIRIKNKGQKRFSATVPIVRTFASVSKAQRWALDAAAAGSFAGFLKFKYEDGGETTVPYAIAQPSDLSHRGVTVSAVWNIIGGELIE